MYHDAWACIRSAVPSLRGARAVKVMWNARALSEVARHEAAGENRRSAGSLSIRVLEVSRWLGGDVRPQAMVLNASGTVKGCVFPLVNGTEMRG
jgi:hypothetical protein